ncbi:MAG: hypothetical protein JSU69_09340 [Candidatus Zixiibacteriota bacterium]|nr:MAG: hypothetical protein JSU69_09340 [candidate division Zixibacteria bacterium]
MNCKNTTLFGLIFILFFLSTQIHAFEIVYGLPDSLDELRFWDTSGDYVGLSAETTCPPVPLITVTPEDPVVERLTPYTIDIELPSVGIPKLGGFVFSFPPGFDLGQISEIEYSDDYEGEDLEIRRAYVYDNFIAIFFQWSLSPPPGTIVALEIHRIGNPSASGTYRIAGLIFNKWFRVAAGPSFSNSFDIIHDEPVTLEVVPDEPLTLQAGEVQVFEAVALDRLGNRIFGLDIEWSLSPGSDDIGIVSSGHFLATAVGEGRVVASYADLSAESGLIAVVPGDMDHFEIVEYPPAVPAGEEFPSPVTVAAYDLFGNIKSDYLGDVYFTSSDPLAELHFDESNKYHFVEIDSGVHSFEGSAFKLVSAGLQTLSVTDGVHLGKSGKINVIDGQLKIKILSADIETLNPPYVNHGQSFSVAIGIANLSSDEEIENVSVFIQSEDGSETFAEAHDIVVAASSTKEVLLDLTAPDYSITAFVYKAVLSAPGITILPPEDNIVAVTVQSPAEIELAYNLHGAYGNYVDYDQPFTVEVTLTNLGEALADSGEISLLTSGVDFGIPDSSAVRLAVGGSAEFNLTAPSTSLSTDLILKITGAPSDKNTGQPALVATESVFIPIIVEPSFAELVVDATVEQAPLVVQGTLRELFQLTFHNETENPVNVIGLKSISIRIAGSNGSTISPELILIPGESGFFTEDGDLIASGLILDTRLKVEFDDFQLEAGAKRTIVFKAKFNDVISVNSFNVSIDSRDIRAVFISGPRENQSVPVRGEYQDIFRVGANFIVIVPDMQSSVATRNNPFDPTQGPAEIAYFLEEDTDVRMTIYTLVGEKVYEQTFPAGSNGGSAGQNYVSWNARNDDGGQVLNGVYVVYLRPGNGDEPATLKLAVMK